MTMTRQTPRMVSALAALIAGCFVLPVQASNCQVGAQVTEKKGQGRTGTVVKMDGQNKNSCYVQFAGGNKPEYFLQWQLVPASKGGQPVAASDTVVRGHYSCWAAAGIAGTMKLEITGSSSYAGNGKSGTYKYDPASQKIQFVSGPWEGFHGKRLGQGKIGVSSRPGGSYMTTCNLK